MNLNELSESMTCSECGGPAFSDLILAEKKDACYSKVRSRYKVWPSAYASGALVQCRKKGAANWGNKSEGVAEGNALGKVLSLPELLDQIKHILTAKHRGIGWRMTMPAENTFLFSAENDYDVWSMLVVEASGDDWITVGHGIVDPDGKPIIFDRQQLPMTLASASEIADEAIQTYHDIDLSDYVDPENDDFERGVAEGIESFSSDELFNKVRSASRKAIKQTGDQSISSITVAVRSVLPSSSVTKKITSPGSLEALDSALRDEGIDFDELLAFLDSQSQYWGREGVAEDFHGEYDDEAGMARTNLITIARAADGLLDTIDQYENLPEWVQEKIAKVEQMLVVAWDYLKSQEAQGIDPRITEMYQGLCEDWQRMSHRVALQTEFSLIESIVQDIAEYNGVDADVVWLDLESLTEDELYAFAVTSQLNEDWQKANKRDRTAGMSRKAVNAYRRENPGSKLQTAVTTKPSKLKRGSKASKRRKSYCSRSRGQMKMHNISCAKTPDKAICKARRRWNC